MSDSKQRGASRPYLSNNQTSDGHTRQLVFSQHIDHEGQEGKVEVSPVNSSGDGEQRFYSSIHDQSKDSSAPKK